MCIYVSYKLYTQIYLSIHPSGLCYCAIYLMSNLLLMTSEIFGSDPQGKYQIRIRPDKKKTSTNFFRSIFDGANFQKNKFSR